MKVIIDGVLVELDDLKQEEKSEEKQNGQHH